MRRFIQSSFAVALALSLVAWRPLRVANPWDKLVGTWSGEGSFSGAPAKADLRWEQVLNGQYYKLTYSVVAKSAQGERRFEGHAYYKAAATPKTVGNWFDAEGNAFNIDAELGDSALVGRWGPGTMRVGKSYYGVSGDRLVMIDSAMGRSGTMGEFARITYSRR